MMRRFWLVLIGFALVFLIAGCGLLPDWLAMLNTIPEPLDEAQITRGVEVYRANYCGACHTLSVANARGTFGPNHDHAGSAAVETIVLETYTGEAETAADYLHESIVNPSVFYTPGYEASNHHMPSFAHLSETDIEALVYMLEHQGN